MKSLIAEMCQAILNSRELCGNEKDAAKQVAEDFGYPFSLDDYQQAMINANVEWLGYKKQAGVRAKYRRF